MFDVTALGELLIDFAPKSVDEAGYQKEMQAQRERAREARKA